MNVVNIKAQVAEEIKDKLGGYIEDLVSICMGGTLCNLWLFVSDDFNSFTEKTEAFFILFEEMLKRGLIKLQRDDKIIEKTPQEWVQIFRQAWPKTEEWFELDRNGNPCPAPMDIATWFILPECPAYVVWVNPEDGSYYWSS